jgi:hypothetical protein
MIVVANCFRLFEWMTDIDETDDFQLFFKTLTLDDKPAARSCTSESDSDSLRQHMCMSVFLLHGSIALYCYCFLCFQKQK